MVSTSINGKPKTLCVGSNTQSQHAEPRVGNAAPPWSQSQHERDGTGRYQMPRAQSWYKGQGRGGAGSQGLLWPTDDSNLVLCHPSGLQSQKVEHHCNRVIQHPSVNELCNKATNYSPRQSVPSPAQPSLQEQTFSPGETLVHVACIEQPPLSKVHGFISVTKTNGNIIMELIWKMIIYQYSHLIC